MTVSHTVLFTSRSYVVCFDAPKATMDILHEMGAHANFRAVNFQTIAELDTALGRIRHCLFALVFGPVDSNSVEQALGRLRLNGIRHERHENLTRDQIDSIVAQLLHSDTQSKMATLVRSAFEKVRSGLCPGFDEVLEQMPYSPIDRTPFFADADYLIHCDSISPTWVARMTLVTNLKRLKASSPVLNPKSDAAVLDLLSEIVNQTLGVINVTLRHEGQAPRVGLVTRFHFDPPAEKVPAGLFMTQCRLHPVSKTFTACYEYIEPARGALDYGELKMGETGDVEFF
jgi:hypothetical protein